MARDALPLVFLLPLLPVVASRVTGRPWSRWRLRPPDEPWAAVPGSTGRVLLLLLALVTLLIALPLTVGRLRG